MVQALKKKLKSEKGFTLIELLAVIVILGIIAAIAIPSVSKIIQNSRVDGARNDVLAVYNGAKLYSSQHNTAAADFTAAANDITLLKGDSIDNTSIATANFTLASNGSLTVSIPTFTVGSVDVTITNATYDQLSNKDNWTPNSTGHIVIPAP